MARALVISLDEFPFFLFDVQLVVCKSIRAYKKSLALNFFSFYFDFDFDFDFFFIFIYLVKTKEGFFSNPRLIITKLY
jgi:hypothetical protein